LIRRCWANWVGVRAGRLKPPAHSVLGARWWTPSVHGAGQARRQGYFTPGCDRQDQVTQLPHHGLGGARPDQARWPGGASPTPGAPRRREPTAGAPAIAAMGGARVRVFRATCPGART
jgi:hypothetical protein